MTSNSIGRGQSSVNIRVQCRVNIYLTDQNSFLFFYRCTNYTFKWWWNYIRKQKVNIDMYC